MNRTFLERKTNKEKGPGVKALALTLLFFMIMGIMPVFPGRLDAAVACGDGSAGDLILTSGINVSTYANKNFNNITINSGGNLCFNVNDTLFVKGTITINTGGRITALTGFSVNIQANDFNLAGGSIASGAGANISGGASDQRFTAGSAGNISISANTFTMSAGSITGGTGGTLSGLPAQYSSYNGGVGGTINITIGSNADISGGTITGGTGGKAGDMKNLMRYAESKDRRTAGSGGAGGNVVFKGLAGSSLFISNSSAIQGGNGGNTGTFLYFTDSYYYYGEGWHRGMIAGQAGKAGGVNISAFNNLKISGNAIVTGGTGGTGGQGGNLYWEGSSDNYAQVLPSSSGGNGGDITISAVSNIEITENGHVFGGTGGISGKTAIGENYKNLYRSTANGGIGGTVNLTLPASGRLYLGTNSLISGGTGGLGNTGIQPYTLGGDTEGGAGGGGGAGGNINFNIGSGATIEKQTKGADNIKTGNGGNAGKTYQCYLYNRMSMWNGSWYYYAYYYEGSPGGKSGDANIVFNDTRTIDYNLVVVGTGGKASDFHYYIPNVTAIPNGQYGQIYNYNFGAGGATGNVAITGPNLTFQVPNVVKYSSSGIGGTNLQNTAVKGPNGTHGNLTITSTQNLNLAATNGVYFSDLNHDGHTASLTNTITLNSPTITLGGSPAIRWGEITGGELYIYTTMNTFQIGHNQINAKFKTAGDISKYNYIFTYNNASDVFPDIPDGGFQLSSEISFALNETLYNRWFSIFTSFIPYYSEDNGTNWITIPQQTIRKDYKYSLPTSTKGNSNLRFGLTLQGPPSNVVFTLNGDNLGAAAFVPDQHHWPNLSSYKYAILESDMSGPTAHMVVNNGNKTVNQNTFPIQIRAFDNLTSEDKLTYQISVGDNKFKKLTYSSSNVYTINLGDFVTNPASGSYNIFLRVIDESFNTGMATDTIYYIPLSEVPSPGTGGVSAGSGAPGGLSVKDFSGGGALQFITYRGAPTWISKENMALLDFSGATYPYFQIKYGEAAWSEITPISTPYKILLGSNQGRHPILMRYCNNLKVPGNQQEFFILVDAEGPTVQVKTENSSTLTRTGNINLKVTAQDAVTAKEDLTYCFTEAGTYQALPASGIVTKSGMSQGLNQITVYVKDQAGNIGSSTVDVWHIN